MKQIFDWLREQIRSREITIDFRIKELLKKDNAADFEKLSTKQMTLLEVLTLINEAEAKWEADCCVWTELIEYKQRVYANCRFTNDSLDAMSIGYFKFCPYCGKPIKISEVE